MGVLCFAACQVFEADLILWDIILYFVENLLNKEYRLCGFFIKILPIMTVDC